MIKLTYQIGNKPIQEWTFNNKSLAYWMKSELLFTGRYNLGTFKIETI